MIIDGERGRNRTYNLLIKSQLVRSNHQLLRAFESRDRIFKLQNVYVCRPIFSSWLRLMLASP